MTRLKTSMGFMSATLRESWRVEPPPLEGSAEQLEQWIVPLIESGAGALVWRRLRGTSLAETSPAQNLKQTHRLQVLNEALKTRYLSEVVTALETKNVQPVLIKGWSCARLYPEKGLRPLGDIDFHVLPEQAALACAILGIAIDTPEEVDEIDLKTGFAAFYEMPAKDVFARSSRVHLPETGHNLAIGSSLPATFETRQVRVLSSEDHLRALCIHFLKHGGWRPMWLCDVAVALESRPSDFDWDKCLNGTSRSANWVLMTLLLAHHLLGANIKETPAENPTLKLPRWVASTVLQQWQRPVAKHHEGFQLMSSLLGQPARWPQALQDRWPDPLSLAITKRLPLDDAPRLPRQIAAYARSGSRFLLRSKNTS